MEPSCTICSILGQPEKRACFTISRVCHKTTLPLDIADLVAPSQSAYDEFWKVVVELDVPIYVHPAALVGQRYRKLYAQRKYLVGPPLNFANSALLHILNIITNGVFDRFPKLKIIVGYLGKRMYVQRSRDL